MPDLDLETIDAILKADAEATEGEWSLCTHLKSIALDRACPCGYRGGIGGPQGKNLVCEMGSTVIPGEEGLELGRYPREEELANAELITLMRNHIRALCEMARAKAEMEVKFNRVLGYMEEETRKFFAEHGVFPNDR